MHLDFLKILRFVARATYQDTENLSDIKAFKGKKLAGRAEESYLIRLEAQYGGLKVYCEQVEEKGLFYDTANLLEAKDKREINAGATWLVGPVLINAEARNLEDEQFEDFNGFPLPGRSYYASVKYSF